MPPLFIRRRLESCDLRGVVEDKKNHFPIDLPEPEPIEPRLAAKPLRALSEADPFSHTACHK